MGCNVSKDVKVEDRHAGGAEKGGEEEGGMSEERAAEKIQASFRGYKTRKTLKDNGISPKQPQQTNDTEEENTSKTEEQSADAKEIVDLDLTDAELERAAVKIQASYRNFTAKKKEQEEEQQQQEQPPPPPPPPQEEEEEVDIDLGDPDVATAALKIQSTFRGYKARKEVRQ